jgi:hypothetical protein
MPEEIGEKTYILKDVMSKQLFDKVQRAKIANDSILAENELLKGMIHEPKMDDKLLESLTSGELGILLQEISDVAYLNEDRMEELKKKVQRQSV